MPRQIESPEVSTCSFCGVTVANQEHDGAFLSARKIRLPANWFHVDIVGTPGHSRQERTACTTCAQQRLGLESRVAAPGVGSA